MVSCSTYALKPYAENVEIGFFFNNFSLSHSKPEILKIEKIDDHTYFVNAVKRVSGESYDNQESTTRYEIIKQNGKWIINNFYVLRIHYYDEVYENGPVYLSREEQAELANMITQKTEAFNRGDADLYASFYDPSFLTAESILQTEQFHNNLLYLDKYVLHFSGG